MTQMTEAQARERACCADRPVSGMNCQGSYCMAWRWSEAKRTEAYLDAVQAHMKTMVQPDFNKAAQIVFKERGRQFERTEGYCGLAGPVAA